MRVIVAETAGFCWGVKRAVEQVLSLARAHKGPVCTLGPLIHNRKLLSQLEGLGITSVTLDDLRGDKGAQATGVKPAHGHSEPPDRACRDGEPSASCAGSVSESPSHTGEEMPKQVRHDGKGGVSESPPYTVEEMPKQVRHDGKNGIPGFHSAAMETMASASARDRRLVVIRAHGVTPQVMDQVRACGVAVHDATCPLVRRAQETVKKKAGEGMDVVIVGDRGHAEVEGLVGYSGGKACVIAGPAEISTIAASDVPTCAIAQTTQDMEIFQQSVAELAKIRTCCEAVDTICGSTKKRQHETRQLAKQVDVMVVVGDRTSANTARLKTVSESAGARTILVEDPSEMSVSDFAGVRTVGITAGASTPSWLIGSIVDRLHHISRQRSGGMTRALLRALDLLVHANVVAAFGAACLVFATSRFQEIPFPAVAATIAALYVFSMHTLNRYVDRLVLPASEEVGSLIYRRYPVPILVACVLTGLAAVATALRLGWLPFVLVALSVAGGAVYGVKILPPTLSGLFGIRRIKDIPASKDLSTAGGWAMLTAVVPFAATRTDAGARTLLAFVFAFVLVLIRSTMLGMRSVQRDIIVGRETVFNVLGPRGTKIALALLISVLAAPLVGLALLGDVSLALRLGIVLLYVVLYIGLQTAKILPHGTPGEFVIEAQFILCGVAALLP
ncbi:MAG: 4-hydroxy-3-methylbut-2-enyl diphosphate reductase [Planctomycetota bacterium]|nr:4-hydroxy-3-methylbut-2-enyl diphosphate reductase [Planctomycetota bacterium]